MSAFHDGYKQGAESERLYWLAKMRATQAENFELRDALTALLDACDGQRSTAEMANRARAILTLSRRVRAKETRETP